MDQNKSNSKPFIGPDYNALDMDTRAGTISKLKSANLTRWTKLLIAKEELGLCGRMCCVPWSLKALIGILYPEPYSITLVLMTYYPLVVFTCHCILSCMNVNKKRKNPIHIRMQIFTSLPVDSIDN